MRSTYAGSIFFLFLISLPATGETADRVLSPRETDAAIDSVFNTAQGVTRMEAELVTRKSGGMIKGSQISYEFLRLETPARMVLINRGASQARIPIDQSTLIIVDGRNIWDVEARRDGVRHRQVSRRPFRPDLGRGQAQGLAIFIGLFLIGRDVTSASGIREDFGIVCVEEPLQGSQRTTLHFTLTPKRGGETLELWILPGQTLPWRVRSFERKEIKFPPPRPGELPRFKVEETLREIREVRTNLNGLPPFAPETFLLPLANDMIIRDERENRVMDIAEIHRELEEVRRSIR
ncbi:MAG: hypothetical protein LBE84_05465 [Planctomycetota bacterium]|nr:hypothetical protein [Planctomycetota bacterium]